MKKIKLFIHRWHYRRLYRRLFWFYTHKGMDADSAGVDAAIAFQWLTALEYADLFKRRRKPDV